MMNLMINLLKIRQYFNNNNHNSHLPFQKVGQRKLRDVTKKVKAVIRYIEMEDVTQTNKLAMTATLQAAKEVGMKKDKKGEKKQPWWKRRTQRDISNLREISADQKGRKIKERNAKHRVKKRD